ncbi:MAG: hypothetical protein KJ650_01455 [Firmicutes bacterium]|nr:hypothetical protein [Bacillota bacterium]MBV1727127.1 hypothetical protein [Desulforudis sp.]MBU4532302.1 hypothetical protein [Bacillota bacterium]MBU4554177.1 hypothetical protein [Bacillota bacterium]MBV1735675.1 hypothetical protein [Desulforudis sp.]
MAQVKPFCRAACRPVTRTELSVPLERLSSYRLFRLLLVLRLVSLTAWAERRSSTALRLIRARLWILAYGSLIEASPAVAEGIRSWEKQNLHRSS